MIFVELKENELLSKEDFDSELFEVYIKEFRYQLDLISDDKVVCVTDVKYLNSDVKKAIDNNDFGNEGFRRLLTQAIIVSIGEIDDDEKMVRILSNLLTEKGVSKITNIFSFEKNDPFYVNKDVNS